MHYFSTITRNNLSSFIAGILVVSLVLLAVLTRHIFAAPALSSSATPENIESVESFEGIAWSSTENAQTDDGSLAVTDELEEGYYLIEDTPTISSGSGVATDFHPVEQYVVVANTVEDAGLTIIDMTTLATVSGTIQPEGIVNTVKFSEDGSFLAVGIDNNGDNEVDLLAIIDSSSEDATEWTFIEEEVQQPGGQVTALEFSPDGSHLAVGYAGGVFMAIYNTNTWSILDDGEVEPAHLSFGINSAVYDFDFSSTGTYLAVAHQSGNQFTVIDTNTWSVLSGYDPVEEESIGTTIPISAGIAIAFTSNDFNLLVGAYDGETEIYVLNAANENPALWTITDSLNPNDGDASGIWSFEFSPDGNELAIAYSNSSYFGVMDTSDGSPSQWVGVDTSEYVGPLAGGKSGNAGHGVAYSPNGEYIAVAHSGGTGLSLISTKAPADTHYLTATGFGFEIPEDATILGVEATVEKSNGGSINQVRDNSVRLVVGGEVTGADMADEEWWSNDEDGEVYVYGDSGDLWDVDLTPEVVNSEDFGLAFSASVFLGTAAVDVMSLTVHYSVPEDETSNRSSSSGSRPRVTTPTTPVPTTPPMSSDSSILTAQIRTLINQYVALGGNLTPELRVFLGTDSISSIEVRDLTLDMEGEDVRMLQTILINQGYSIPPGATAYFGTYTRDALATYQTKNGIIPSVGYFGMKTRTQMKSVGLSGLWW